jgi:hypothetical protein
MRFWRWDYSYYKGHIYLYWGLLPPALLAAVKAIFRIQRGVTDDPVVFAFLAAQAIAGALLIRAMARRLTPRPPGWSVWSAMALFALAHPTPFLLARGAIYEGAIVGGSFFMVLAFASIFAGIFAERPGAGLRFITLASLFAGFAGASRANLFPVAAVTMTLAALARWRVDGGGWRRLLRSAPIAAAPLTAVTLGHMLLNRLRFDEWTEFGVKYQMGFKGLFVFEPRFSLADAFVYFLRAPSRWCHFPFITAEWGDPKNVFPTFLPVPTDYRVIEPTAGLLVMVPFLGFLLLLPFAVGLVRRLRGSTSRDDDGAGAGTAALPVAIAASTRWRWFLAVVVVATLVTLVVPLLAVTATMRYEGDFAPPLLLLAVVGGWAWLAAFRRRWARGAAAAVFILLAAAAIAAGMLMGFTGYFNHFERHNPQLLHAIQKSTRICHGP